MQIPETDHFKMRFCETESFVLLALLSLGVGFTVTSAYDCSSLYFKESEGVLNYLANVSFIVPVNTENQGWTIYFTFDRDFTGVGVWVGSIVSNGPEGTAAMTNGFNNADLNATDPFYFRFRINWFEQTPAKNPPTLISLRFGDIELCQDTQRPQPAQIS